MAAAGAVLDLSGEVSSSFPPAAANQGLVPFEINVELDSTDVDHADDAILVFQFPPVAYILNGAGNITASFDDLDSDGTPTAEIDVAVGGSDGVADYLLITGDTATAAEAGGAVTQAVIATSGAPAWIDVGGLYLQLVVRTAAATAQDGGVKIGGFYTQNLVTGESISSTNL